MAKEESDEIEQENEEEEEEERPPPKKRRGPRNNFSTRAHGSPGGPNLYPKGTPVDARGMPLENVDVDRSVISRIGGYDAESARIAEQSKRVLDRKARGEANVKWNSDAHTRYWEVRRLHPRAKIALTQEFPVQDESLAPVSFAICPTYEDLKQHVRERYWKGNRAIYAWRIYEDNYSSLAIGRFEFAENLDWEPVGRHEPVQNPQAPAPQQPFGQFGMPGVMMPGVGGMPPIFMPQQAAPQPSHQPNPVATPTPGDPMAVIGPLLNYLLPLISNQAAQSAYLQNLPQVIEQKVKEAAPPPAPPAPPAPPPPTPVEQMEQAAAIISTVNRAGKQIAGALGFQQNPNQVNEPPPPNGEDDFPIQVRRVGMVNVAAQDGKVVDNMFLQGAVNAGPVLGLVDSFFKRLSDSKKESAEIELKTLEAKKEWEKQRLENLEKAAALQQQMQAPQRQQETDPWQAPAWSVERKPPPPEPEPTS